MTDVPGNFGSGRDSQERCALVEQHWPDVFRLMFRLCGNVHDAQELTQEAFLRALQKAHQFQPGTNMRGWLLRIGTNAFLDGRRRQGAVSLSADAGDLAGADEGASARLEQSELAGQLRQAIGKLPQAQRVVFLLRTTEEMSFAEISRVIDTSEATARWHMMQARQQLLKWLEGKL